MGDEIKGYVKAIDDAAYELLQVKVLLEVFGRGVRNISAEDAQELPDLYSPLAVGISLTLFTEKLQAIENSITENTEKIGHILHHMSQS